MKKPTKKKSISVAAKKRRMFRAKVEFNFHPEIDPDDAANALNALFWRSYGDRKKPRRNPLLLASIPETTNF